MIKLMIQQRYFHGLQKNECTHNESTIGPQKLLEKELELI